MTTLYPYSHPRAEEDADDESILGHHRSAGSLRVPFDKLYAALAQSLHAEEVGAWLWRLLCQPLSSCAPPTMRVDGWMVDGAHRTIVLLPLLVKRGRPHDLID